MILIADDNENDMVTLVALLKAAGVKNRIVSVADGRDVIAYFKGKNEYGDREQFPLPSILLLDLKMRQIGGFEVLEWLNGTRLAKDVLTVILSGFGELENIKRGYQLGAKSFLVKPCRIEDISNLIRSFPRFWQTGTSDAPHISDQNPPSPERGRPGDDPPPAV